MTKRAKRPTREDEIMAKAKELALARPCPRCKVKAGEPCVSRTFTAYPRTVHHGDRYGKLWWDEAAAALDQVVPLPAR